MDELLVYFLSILPFFFSLPILWRARKLTILRIVILLFVFDSLLTLEAAFYGNVVFIAILHVVTIPAFLSLLYFDLLNLSKKSFTCFICSKRILPGEDVESLSRIVEGVENKFLAHSSCLSKERRASISKLKFKNGIME
jgi:hypothetical protein